MNNKIYHGSNIHAYSGQIRMIVCEYVPNIVEKYGDIVSGERWSNLLNELKAKYGNKPALGNIGGIFRSGWIKDPDVPSLNSSVLLLALWDKMKQKNEESMYNHFGETLDGIGRTCIQGVSHRLLIDYVALINDEKSILEAMQKAETEKIIIEVIDGLINFIEVK